MSPEQAWARIDRLAELSRSLGVEASIIKRGLDPLLYLERKEYLDGLAAAVAGLEKARVALATARQRAKRADPAA